MTKKLTISALLVALAMILSYVEVLISFNFGISGIKFGLVNLVVVVALYLLNARQALMISVVRILLVSFTFGNMAALLSTEHVPGTADFKVTQGEMKAASQTTMPFDGSYALARVFIHDSLRRN